MLENVYEGLNARPEVYLSKEYFCEMYPTCVSSKLCKFIFFNISILQLPPLDLLYRQMCTERGNQAFSNFLYLKKHSLDHFIQIRGPWTQPPFVVFLLLLLKKRD